MLQVTESALFTQLFTDGHLIALDDEVIPGLADYPSDFVTPFSFSQEVVALGLCVNTDQVDPASITSWNDLATNPDIKVAAADPNLTPVFTAYWLNVLNATSAETIEQIAANLEPVASTVPGMELVKAGEANVLAHCPVRAGAGCPGR